MTEQQRRTKHLVAALRSDSMTARLEAATALSDLAGSGTKAQKEIAQVLKGGTLTEQRNTLGCVLSLADAQTPDDDVLRKKSIPASVIDMIMQDGLDRGSSVLVAYLSQPTSLDGAAGVRYVVRRLPDHAEYTRELKRCSLAYAHRLLARESTSRLFSLGTSRDAPLGVPHTIRDPAPSTNVLGS